MKTPPETKLHLWSSFETTDTGQFKGTWHVWQPLIDPWPNLIVHNTLAASVGLVFSVTKHAQLVRKFELTLHIHFYLHIDCLLPHCIFLQNRCLSSSWHVCVFSAMHTAAARWSSSCCHGEISANGAKHQQLAESCKTKCKLFRHFLNCFSICPSQRSSLCHFCSQAWLPIFILSFSA